LRQDSFRCHRWEHHVQKLSFQRVRRDQRGSERRALWRATCSSEHRTRAHALRLPLFGSHQNWPVGLHSRCFDRSDFSALATPSDGFCQPEYCEAQGELSILFSLGTGARREPSYGPSSFLCLSFLPRRYAILLKRLKLAFCLFLLRIGAGQLGLDRS
jgi:hypothetical protein